MEPKLVKFFNKNYKKNLFITEMMSVNLKLLKKAISISYYIPEIDLAKDSWPLREIPPST
jgi:hypothetical protein